MSRNQVIHTPDEIARIRRAAALTAQVRDEIAAAARPGMTTFDLDQVAGELIRATGGKSAFFGYRGYPGNICISVNDEVVHGIGRPDRILLESDIVSIDVGVEIDGGVGDTALTFGFGELTPDLKRLLTGTREALDAGIRQARRGNYIRDISHAVEDGCETVSPRGGTRIRRARLRHESARTTGGPEFRRVRQGGAAGAGNGDLHRADVESRHAQSHDGLRGSLDGAHP